MKDDVRARQAAVLAHLFGPCTGRTTPQPLLARSEAVTPASGSMVQSSTSPQPRASLVPAARAAADVTELSWGNEAAIEQELRAILAAGQHRALSELAGDQVAPDGGIAIDSMSAVFLYSIVFDILGRRAMPRLGANSRASDFVSTHSLARLVHRLRHVEAVA